MFGCPGKTRAEWKQAGLSKRILNTLPRFAQQCVEAMITHRTDARFDPATTLEARGHRSVMR